MLVLNLAFVWPMCLAAIGAVVGIPGAAIVMVFGETEAWQDIPAFVPTAMFYGALIGAGYGVIMAVAAGLLGILQSGHRHVEALRSAIVSIASGVFLAGAVALNDTMRDRVAFVGRYGLLLVLGTWIGWHAVPAIVRTYAHRMR